MNIGKYKLITQQAWGIISVPVAIATNLGVIFGVFSPELAAVALLLIIAMFIGVMFFVNKVTLGQEYNYAWEKTPAFTEFRKETLDRLKSIESKLS